MILESEPVAYARSPIKMTKLPPASFRRQMNKQAAIELYAWNNP